MSNQEMSEELREAIQRGLEASIAPGADIYLSYEESEALWATAQVTITPSRWLQETSHTTTRPRGSTRERRKTTALIHLSGAASS